MSSIAELSERAARAEISASALKELDSAFDEVANACMKRAMELAAADPTKRDADAMLNLSLFIRAINEARNVMKVKAVDGQAAREQIAHLRKIEQMSPERRRWADLAGAPVV